MNDYTLLLVGALVMACAIVGLVFVRFWRSSRDSLFLFLALSFWLQGGQWLATAHVREQGESSPTVYLLRLAAYGLIVFAILRRNLRGPRDRSGE